MMNKLLLSSFVFCAFFLLGAPVMAVHAQGTYTLTDIATHNTPEDCFMAIEGTVYDLSDYLPNHDRMLDIRSWCGTEATVAYNDKAGRDKDHSPRADEMLAPYAIGALVDEPAVALPAQNGPRYPIGIPMIVTALLYFATQAFLARHTHSFLWNTALLLGLIPSMGYGVIMAVRDQFPAIAALEGPRMLYDHVIYSTVFGTAAILHFITRVKLYIGQWIGATREKNIRS